MKNELVAIHRAAVCNDFRVPTELVAARKSTKISPPPGDWTSEERTLCCSSGSHAQHRTRFYFMVIYHEFWYFLFHRRYPRFSYTNHHKLDHFFDKNLAIYFFSLPSLWKFQQNTETRKKELAERKKLFFKQLTLVWTTWTVFSGKTPWRRRHWWNVIFIFILFRLLFARLVTLRVFISSLLTLFLSFYVLITQR